MVSLGQRWGPSPGLRDDQRGETGWEVGGRFKTEEIRVHLWLIRADLWQKPTQHCKAITLQLKINKLKKLILQTVLKSMWRKRNLLTLFMGMPIDTAIMENSTEAPQN